LTVSEKIMRGALFGSANRHYDIVRRYDAESCGSHELVTTNIPGGYQISVTRTCVTARTFEE